MIKILEFDKVKKDEIFLRDEIPASVAPTVTKIIDEVKRDGDEALFRFALKFDHVKLNSLLVTKQEIDEAFSSVSDEFKNALMRAKENIERFHRAQKRESFVLTGKDGTVIGQRVIPISNVGLYVPGGTAAYPSTVLMDAIPAKIAGCECVMMATPPMPDGSVNKNVLAAAKIAGVDKIFKIGGAGAIAAMAFGTESVKKCDKIVGPGNAFVAEAKKQVFGTVSIDMVAGPSEILVCADSEANPAFVAADLLSQAEHDKMATAVLVTDSMELAKQVQAEIEKQIPELLRSEIARASIDQNGKIIIADDLKKVIDIANEFAPEHLELCVKNPFDFLDSVKHAGSVFLGYNCPEALGDYIAGPNHTLPTSGTARFSSPLSVDDFVKKSQYTYYSKEAFEACAKDVDILAKSEGLTAHAKSATIRCEEKK